MKKQKSILIDKLTFIAQFFILLSDMLMIRFQRRGRTNDPSFRIVVQEKRSKPKSGELEILGSFHPKTKATIIKNDRILYWISKGAKPSPRVHNLLISKGVIRGKKINVAKTASTVEVKKIDTETPKQEKEASVTITAI